MSGPRSDVGVTPSASLVHEVDLRFVVEEREVAPREHEVPAFGR
jgi:hypothetical protein